MDALGLREFFNTSSVHVCEILSTASVAIRAVDGGGIEIVTNSPRLHAAIVKNSQ